MDAGIRREGGAVGGVCQSDIGSDGRQGIEQGAEASSTGESRYRTTSFLERFNQEMRARERMGTAWIVNNLLVLLQLRGVLV